MEGPEVLTLDEAAAFLRLHRETVRRLLQRGVLPGVKVGGTWRIHRRDLEEYLRRGGRTKVEGGED